MKYFKVIEAPYDNSHYLISGTDNYYKYFSYTDGSYNVFNARIMGLSYPSYLRFARDSFGAKLKGQGHKYPIAYFDSEAQAKELAILLDERLSSIIKKTK